MKKFTLREPTAEFNMADLYEEAVKEFESVTTIDKASLLADWPALRERLTAAANKWGGEN